MYATRRDVAMIIRFMDEMVKQRINPENYEVFRNRIMKHLESSDTMTAQDYEDIFAPVETTGQFHQHRIDFGD